MEKLKQLTLEDPFTKYSLSDPIPVDILIDIFSRVPAKSICRFRCVSKFWASILGRLDFTELFLTKSLTRPRLLFTFILHRNLPLPFFTSPQQENSSCFVATPLRTFSLIGFPQISRPVRGWVCIEQWYSNNKFVIYNPVTGKDITLPKLITKMDSSTSFLGYDPIDKQLKILCTTWSQYLMDSHAEHYVLTLGTEKMAWRMIDECSKPLCRPSIICGRGICISGVLYYIAEFNFHEDVMICCFDIKYEKLSFINRPEYLERVGYESRLINHKGQLCIIQSSDNFGIDGSTTSFTLWVLKDAEKHEWTKHFYVSPLLWWDVVGNTRLHIIGMTGTCEIVLAPEYLLSSCPFYIFYYNLEMNIVRKIRIRGFGALLEEHKCLPADCFLDYVEDVKLI